MYPRADQFLQLISPTPKKRSAQEMVPPHLGDDDDCFYYYKK